MARQFLVPGTGFVCDVADKEFLVPGSGFLNESGTADVELSLSVIALTVTSPAVTAILTQRRKFPLPPAERQLQSQVNKRKFPVVV